MKKLISFQFTLFLIVILSVISAAKAQQITVHFNDRGGLLAMPKEFLAGLYTYGNFYRENGMLFMDGIHPPQRGLVAIEGNHLHLPYQDESIVDGIPPNCFTCPRVPGRQTPNGFVPVVPENEDRALSPFHLPGSAVQMIYDPDGNYDPVSGEGADPFNLISLVVHGGKLNVGVKSSDFGIGVYNNLTPGYQWFLIDANNLTRATFEFPKSFGYGANFVIDEIVFEPLNPPVVPVTTSRQNNKTLTAVKVPLTINSKSEEANKIVDNEVDSTKINDIVYVENDPILQEVLNMGVRSFAVLDIEKANVKIVQGATNDQFHVKGSMKLADESNGVNISFFQSVLITFGSFTEWVPGFLFNCSNSGEIKKCRFHGLSGGITNMVISTEKNEVQFSIEAEGLNLSEISNDKLLVPFSLQIGDDIAMRNVQVKCEKLATINQEAKADFLTGHEANSTGFKTIIYPNPAISTIHIKIENANDNVVVELLDNAAGRVAQQNISSRSSGYTSFDVSKLAAGIYWIRITGGGNQTIQKIVVSHNEMHP